MGVKTLSGIMLIALCIAPMTAAPEFRIGPRVTGNHPILGPTAWQDSLGRILLNVVVDQPYWATGLELSYGPFYGFGLRAELAQVRLFTHGGAQVVLMPYGADLTFEPPVHWRVLPYCYFGGQISTNPPYNSSLIDSVTQILPDEGHVHGGLGVKFRLTPRIDLVGEVQAYSFDTRSNVELWLPGIYTNSVEIVGIGRLHVGARFALGK